MMPLVQLGIVAAQPDAAHGKSAIALFLRDAGLLQQRQRAAAGAEKDEFRRGRPPVAALCVLGLQPPAPAGLASDIVHAMGVVDGKPGEPLEIADEMAGEGTVIDIGAGDHAGHGHGLIGRTAFHHERNPFRDFLLVLRVFHPFVGVVRGQRRVSLLEESDVFGAANETHVWTGMDERVRVGDRTLGHEIGPQLPGEVELHVDLERLGNVDAPVATLRRVVQLAHRRMAGPGIVPGVGALLGRAAEGLVDLDAERRGQLLEEHRERGAHDAGADEDDVRLGAGALAIHDAFSSAT